jgi:transcriptional regulator with XRE-family HTH domain
MLSRMSSTIRTLWKRMKSKEYRESFVASHVSNTIAAQIFMMREDREWTQTILAEKAGMKQSRISALEDPDFENVEIATLRRLASAFDVGLSVRFVPFSEIAVQASNLETSDLCVMNFDRDALPMWEQKSPTAKGGQIVAKAATADSFTRSPWNQESALTKTEMVATINVRPVPEGRFSSNGSRLYNYVSQISGDVAGAVAL